MKKIYSILSAAALVICGCSEKTSVWGDPGEITDISAEGIEDGVEVIFKAPLDNEDYYFTQISYYDAKDELRNVRISRFDVNEDGYTHAAATGLDVVREYSFSATPYSYGGAAGKTLTVSGTPITMDEVGYMDFSLATASNNMTISKTDSYEYHIETTGLDPNVQTLPLSESIKGKKLTYWYKARSVGGGLQLYFICNGQAVTQWARQSTVYYPGALSDTSEWTYCELDLSEYINNYSWGRRGDALRFDFGNSSGAVVDIKLILFR